MRVALPPYPVDRYLVQCSEPIELNHIFGDNIWTFEPSLKPEDEIMLKKLHDMLQSTAEDLKELSGELSKFHQPGVQHKTAAIPLDEEFNEKVHIEELVNAKFHGYKVVEPESKINLTNTTNVLNTPPKLVKDMATQADNKSKFTKINGGKKNLTCTRLKSVQISETNDKRQINAGKKPKNFQTIGYKEIAFDEKAPPQQASKLPLNIQEMPSINIRSELKIQNVFSLNILPKETQNDFQIVNKNTVVIDVDHETESQPISQSIAHVTRSKYHQPTYTPVQPARKVTKLSTCSSDTTNISSEPQRKRNVQKPSGSIKSSSSVGNIKNKSRKTATGNLYLKQNDQTKQKRLLSIYGKNNIVKRNLKPSNKTFKVNTNEDSARNTLNNAQYVPYSQLTLGGVKLSQLEREISDLNTKDDTLLSPILDKLLSRESSFHNESPKKSPNILSKSDEDLLDDVIDIQCKISQTLSKSNIDGKPCPESVDNPKSEESKDESYDDDFETGGGGSQNSNESNKTEQETDQSSAKEEPPNVQNETSHSEDEKITDQDVNDKSETTKKTSKKNNLSFKNSVDIFEFVHSVDTLECATQSHCAQLISPKETQTSPTNSKIQPIHNDLWSSPIDPAGEVTRMFQLEKELIKQLILEEYGDLLHKSVSKPSTSQAVDNKDSLKNMSATQKNTQTSPARVKSVMTSPRTIKTRTTSPFMLNLTVDHHTSPMSVSREERDAQTDEDRSEVEDLGISINLSSPRFSLRLPRTSREVLSNLEVFSRRSKTFRRNTNSQRSPKPQRKMLASSTSMDADYSSSELSSLGEIKLKLRRSVRRGLMATESSASSSTSSLAAAAAAVTDGTDTVPDTAPSNDDHRSIGQI